MTASGRVDYQSLESEYCITDSLMAKKIRIIDSYLPNGESLLDVGTGTGALIELEKEKFKRIVGVDCDEEALKLCFHRFEGHDNIALLHARGENLNHFFGNEEFDSITILDILEHMSEEDCKALLATMFELLKKGGVLVFSGPGIFEKIRILLGRSPTHVHSHSSFGWARMIEKAGFTIMSIETVEFPLIGSDLLRKRLHIFGKCCVIVATKKSGGDVE